jgi:chromosome segregation ATPase
MCDKFKAKASELRESKKKVGGKAKDILEQLKETKAALSKVQSSEKALLKEVSELKSKSVRASDEYKDRLRETESDWSQKLARADKEAALKLRDLEVQITTLSDKLLDAEREGEETLKEIAHLKTTHHSLKEEKLNLSESIDVLQNENRDLLQSVQELKTKNEDQLNATNAAGRTEIDALRTECEKYKADYDILKERKSKLGEQAKQILAKLNQTKESLASKDAKVAQLSQELVASSAELDRLRGDVSAQNKERESENSNWENLVAELKATNVVLMEKVQSSNEKIADLMNESNSASGEINDTKSILASLIKEKEDLVETCESKDASIADIQDRLDRKQEMLQKLAARYKKVQEALAQSKAQLAQGHAAENSEFEEMKNKLQSMELKWSSRDKELIDKDDECIRLKKQLAEMQEAHAKNEESYEHNEKKYSSLEEKFEKMEADFESYKGKARAALKAQVDSDVHKVQELMNEMDALESAKAVAEKQANESKSNLKEILEKLKMAKTKHMESEGRAKELQKEIVELKEEITQFKEKIGEFAIVKERFRGQFQEEKEVLQTQINGLTERLNELTSTQKKDDHPSSMPENTPSRVGDIRSFNATMDLRTPPADTPDTFAPSLPANDWRNGMGIDALTAASLIEDALSGYQPPTTDRYGQLSAHELGGFKYDGEEDFTHAPSIFQSSSMMPSRELEESAAITAKQAKDESGKQENVLMAAVNSVVEEYSEYDILEKTDPTFSSMRTKLPLKEQLEEAIAQLAQLRQEHSEAKERNELHLAQENILKDEIRELRAQLSRDNSLVRGADSHINLEYLKNCVYQYMSTDEPEERLVLVDPISNILKFRKEEKEVVKKVASYEANATVLSSFTNFFSPYTPATQ